MGICGDAKAPLIAGLVLTIVAFVIHLIGFATPFWNYSKTDVTLFGVTLKITAYFGLWTSCRDTVTSVGSTLECGKF